ncbi:hypothetical protein K3729_03515 [Rhodobacteraceae bacterium S2214]|nr:hypothetical protein K3729_03515 [Rhodobacteraceae bacterium S2214]
MFQMFPQEVREGLEQARKQSLKRNDRLCVHDGDDVYRILRLWDNGFALDAKTSPRLRGRVEIYDGSRHLYQCLVIDSELDGQERVFDFKWVNTIPDRPPADFVREQDAPIALLPR